MPEPTDPAEPELPTIRDRVVSSAIRLTAEVGWAGVTMSKVAEAAGVSRQTVYNETGGRTGLAETMVDAELRRFLSVVEAAFDTEPDDLVPAVRRATHEVLVLAEDNPLLRAIVSATHGGDTELLPLLTTQADSLLQVASAVLRERLRHYGVPLSEEQLSTSADAIVRLVLSHLTRPTDDPASTADDIAWIAGRVLA